MSKMDNLRAMREARYAANADRAAKAQGTRAAVARPPVAPRTTAVRPALARAATDTPESPASVTEADDELCGHRNMGGRTCTRERGHTAKSHRYS